MVKYLAAISTLLLMAVILSRVLMLKRRGIRALVFAETHRTDLLLPPFGLLLFYLIFAHAFGWPRFGGGYWFAVPLLAWCGLIFQLLALAFVAYALVSFGASFRIGIDAKTPDKLITKGAFAWSRNPLYAGFLLWLLGNWLIFPNWLFALYFLLAGTAMHCQILREEDFCRAHYGEEYVAYCRRVGRYL